MQEKLPLSISIISFNEEDNLGRTLESIKDISSEIVVVDSHSTDKTREIAESYGAKVFEEDWKGHIAQKNSAFEKCGEEWILSLDCDEVVSEELKKSIIEKISNPDAEAYSVNRRTFYMGKFLNYVWQPDWKVRLVKKTTKARWDGYNPHDNLIISGPSANLKGELFHYSYRNVGDHFDRTVNYAKVAAQSYYVKGNKFHWYNPLLNPISAFGKVFIFQLGFLDGYRGFIIAASSFFYTFLKYVFLWEIERNKDRNHK